MSRTKKKKEWTRLTAHGKELPSRTTEEIADDWSAATAKVARQGVFFQDKTLSDEALLNAVALWFMKQPLERQLEIAREFVPVFEAKSQILPAYKKGASPGAGSGEVLGAELADKKGRRGGAR